MSDGRSYPVTPLAAFGLSDAFDNWDAINATNAPNLGSTCPGIPPMPQHAGMNTAGPAVEVVAVPSAFSCELGCCWRGWR